MKEELDKQEHFNKENPVKEVFNSEPVAWIYERPDGSAKLVWVREPHDKSIIKEIPLYTAPQTKPLSDEEIMKLWYKSLTWALSAESLGSKVTHGVYFARAIEAKVRGEK